MVARRASRAPVRSQVCAPGPPGGLGETHGRRTASAPLLKAGSRTASKDPLRYLPGPMYTEGIDFWNLLPRFGNFEKLIRPRSVATSPALIQIRIQRRIGYRGCSPRAYIVHPVRFIGSALEFWPPRELLQQRWPSRSGAAEGGSRPSYSSLGALRHRAARRRGTANGLPGAVSAMVTRIGNPVAGAPVFPGAPPGLPFVPRAVTNGRT